MFVKFVLNKFIVPEKRCAMQSKPAWRTVSRFS